MAITVPESIPKKATAGERTLFQTLKQYLDDDYIVYYEADIHGYHPDFVIIGPDLGIVVLEVKDYTLNTLHQLNHEEWVIRTSSGQLANVKPPLKQARDYMFQIMNQLKKDINLIQHEGKYRRNLKFPCGYGAVFTRLDQQQFIANDLYDVMEPNFVLTRDEIDPDKEHFSAEQLVEKLFHMFSVPFRLENPLTYEEINAIRFHLFPEVRISASVEKKPYRDQLLLSLHNVQAMDLHQEKLARQIGDKNRLLRGVAGSGKTLVLTTRVKLLHKEHPDWKILVLCYNISLAKTIEGMILAKLNEPEDLVDMTNEKVHQLPSSIRVTHFHDWLYKDLKTREKKLPLLLEKLDKKEAILPQYDAILIDEGQDFQPEWLKLVSYVLNPDTQSMLLVEDRAQTIYKRKTSYLQDTGLDFRGRSKILSINYRNTAQIVKFAWDFYQKHSVLQNKIVKAEFEGQEIIAPQSTQRKGAKPIVYKGKNTADELEKTVLFMKKLREERKVPYDEMAILYRVKRTQTVDVINVVQKQLTKENIPFYWLTENQTSKQNYQKEDGRVKICTLESSKGLDFQAVFIINIESLPFVLEKNQEREAPLLYIGMTRAVDYLMLTYSGESKFTAYFDELLGLKSQNKTILHAERSN